MTLTERCKKIEKLFNFMNDGCTGNYKKDLVEKFRKENPELNSDLDFCFEVLAGKVKLGYTLFPTGGNYWKITYDEYTIKEFYAKELKTTDLSEIETWMCSNKCNKDISDFMYALCNREYRLGYSNKNAMKDAYTPMLAKKYPEDFHIEGQEGKYFYVQEKLDGNRCIAYYSDNGWKFRSRSGKDKDLPIDMSGMDTQFIYDGEVMTYGKAGTRDFNATSGVINSKYLDKSSLHYYVYDIVDTLTTQINRTERLLSQHPTGNVTILKTRIMKLYNDTSMNTALDNLLDEIVSAGGEGLMIRDWDAPYEQTRSSALLKYKGVQTMDMEVIGIEEGTGKYTGMVGSLHCRCYRDDTCFECWVGSGLSDHDRASWKPEDIIGRIVEVAYFSTSESKENKGTGRLSLRFPRLKRVRYDKSETSPY